MLPNLSKLRDEKRISQQKLAEILGLTQPTINKYENHNNQPDFDTLRRMADYFNTSVDFIIGHTDIRRKIESVEEYALNEQEQTLVNDFRMLSPEERDCILHVLRTLRQKSTP